MTSIPSTPSAPLPTATAALTTQTLPSPSSADALYSVAAERNTGPILQVLAGVMAQLPAGVQKTGRALEIASGTGQHIAAMAKTWPHWSWQPSDYQDGAFLSIAAWANSALPAQVQPAVRLDVTHMPWPSAVAHPAEAHNASLAGAINRPTATVATQNSTAATSHMTASTTASTADDFGQPFDLIYCANMLHIAPWECCTGLMQGAARHLAGHGLLVTYGPYWQNDVADAPSNQAFDSSLRARNPLWGIRHLDAVMNAAEQAGLRLHEHHAMPSNNLLLVFKLA